KDILSSGRLGKPYAAHAAFAHGGPENWSPAQTWYFDPHLGGPGVIADLGSHKIDLLRWLLAQEVSEISAFAATHEKATPAADTAVIALKFSQGALGTIHVSWAYRPGLDDHVTISCERGVLHVPTDAAQPVRVVSLGEDGKAVESTYAFDATDVPGWSATIAAFTAAVRDKQPSPVPGIEGKRTMAAVFAAYEAVTRKIVVKLKH
ncbi:MAG: Gfo/Idh/MocA family oxidoreductase, partial [Anaerolineae bacterium]|nr:Gfo/Idh/MocA family oxidoreductase [Anaerolineae bacterium]